MVKPVGKPCKAHRETVIGVIKNYRDRIILGEKVISKLDPVWQQISKDLNHQLKPGSLYSMVCKNNIRQQIDPIHKVNTSNVDDSVTSNVSIHNDSSVEPGFHKFTIWADRREYVELMEPRIYKRIKAARAKAYDRECTVLAPGLWEEWISDEIYKTTQSSCAYNFRYAKVIKDGTHGTMTGRCDCKGTITCTIIMTDDTPDENVRIDCTATKGQGKCGKRYLRAPIRQLVAQELLRKSAVVYRAEQADKRMQPGDPEPPTLYKKSALNNARYEYEASQYLDRDPLRALQIMKLELLQNSIHGIGLDPFYVHYWTNHQLHVFRDYAKRGPACIRIDATGGVVRKLEKPDGTKSSHPFLYHAVVNNQHGQFTVCQMISERHTTVAISYWLAEWISQAGIYPREVICDSSKALLTAAIRSFTGYGTIEEYANACSHPVMPPCYVRIDVAHFIKMYANLLKDSPKRIKVFYLAVLGQLIQIRDIDTAKEMLKSVLTVARSATDGNLPCGQQTQCEIHRNSLKNWIDPSSEPHNEDNDVPTAVHPELDSVFIDSESSTFWYSWGRDIDVEVTSVLQDEEGDRDNAHFLPKFADRLLSDVRWFPMWSCVCRDLFKYGRVPASSAPVESEFNMIKTHLLRNDPRPLRADTFVKRHLGYISGHTKIVDAQVISSNIDATDTAGSIASSSWHDANSPNVKNDAEIIEDSFEFPQTSVEDSFEFPQASIEANPEDTDLPIPAIKTCVTVSPPPSEPEKQPKGSVSCGLCLATLRSDSADAVIRKSRICVECTSLESTAKIIASREIEDWGGLASTDIKGKSRQKSKYLKKNHITFDSISNDALSKIPIMKNGNTMTLQASRFGSGKYSFTKTCALDSATNAILVAAFDRPQVKKVVDDLKADNPIFNLVMDIMTKGLRAQSYQLRAQILLDQHESVRSIGNSHLINCEINVCPILAKAFTNTPSLREISPCTKGCEYIEKPLRTISVNREHLIKSEEFDNILRHVLSGRGRGYCVKCHAPTDHIITATGPLLIMETDGVGVFMLDDIPKGLCDPLSDGKSRYRLIGIIDFTPPRAATRSVVDNIPGLGHYTTIALRPPNSYFQFDDTRANSKPKRLPGTYEARPHALVWFKFDE